VKVWFLQYKLNHLKIIWRSWQRLDQTWNKRQLTFKVYFFTTFFLQDNIIFSKRCSINNKNSELLPLFNFWNFFEWSLNIPYLFAILIWAKLKFPSAFILAAFIGEIIEFICNVSAAITCAAMSWSTTGRGVKVFLGWIVPLGLTKYLSPHSEISFTCFFLFFGGTFGKMQQSFTNFNLEHTEVNDPQKYVSLIWSCVEKNCFVEVIVLQ